MFTDERYPESIFFKYSTEYIFQNKINSLFEPNEQIEISKDLSGVIPFEIDNKNKTFWIALTLIKRMENILGHKSVFPFIVKWFKEQQVLEYFPLETNKEMNILIGNVQNQKYEIKSDWFMNKLSSKLYTTIEQDYEQIKKPV